MYKIFTLIHVGIPDLLTFSGFVDFEVREFARVCARLGHVSTCHTSARLAQNIKLANLVQDDL